MHPLPGRPCRRPPSHRAILAFIATFQAEHAYPPTYRQIAAALDLTLNTTFKHVRKLMLRGALSARTSARQLWQINHRHVEL